MRIRLTLLLAAALAGGCSTPSGSPEQTTADQCQPYRNLLRTQEPHYVMEACARRLGEAACRKCLNE
jgi:hypothetical protein